MFLDCVHPIFLLPEVFSQLHTKSRKCNFVLNGRVIITLNRKYLKVSVERRLYQIYICGDKKEKKTAFAIYS